MENLDAFLSFQMYVLINTNRKVEGEEKNEKEATSFHVKCW